MWLFVPCNFLRGFYLNIKLTAVTSDYNVILSITTSVISHWKLQDDNRSLNSIGPGTIQWYPNSLAPGRFERNFNQVIFNLTLVIAGWGISCKIALRWMSLHLTGDKSTLVQVMAWCCQAISHYLSQCWLSSLLPYGITRPQWVKTSISNTFWWLPGGVFPLKRHWEFPAYVWANIGSCNDMGATRSQTITLTNVCQYL